MGFGFTRFNAETFDFGVEPTIELGVDKPVTIDWTDFNDSDPGFSFGGGASVSGPGSSAGGSISVSISGSGFASASGSISAGVGNGIAFASASASGSGESVSGGGSVFAGEQSESLSFGMMEPISPLPVLDLSGWNWF